MNVVISFALLFCILITSLLLVCDLVFIHLHEETALLKTITPRLQVTTCNCFET